MLKILDYRILFDSRTLFDLNIKEIIKRYVKRFNITFVFLFILPLVFIGFLKIVKYLISTLWENNREYIKELLYTCQNLIDQIPFEKYFEEFYRSFIELVNFATQLEPLKNIIILFIILFLSRIFLFITPIKKSLKLAIPWIIYCGLIGYLNLKIYGLIGSLLFGFSLLYFDKVLIRLDQKTLFELDSFKILKRYLKRFFIVNLFFVVLPAISIASIKLYIFIKQNKYIEEIKDYFLDIKNIIKDISIQDWIEKISDYVDQFGKYAIILFKLLGIYILIVFAIILIRIIGFIKKGKINWKFALGWILFFVINGLLFFGNNGLLVGFLLGTFSFIYIANIIVYWKHIIIWIVFCGFVGFMLYDIKGLLGGLLLGVLTFLPKN